MARTRAKLGDRLRATVRPWELASYGALPALVIGYAGWWVLQTGNRERDFGIFRTAAAAVAHGRSPYPPAVPAILGHFDKFVYPPLSAILYIPFAQISLTLGQGLSFVLGVACVLLTLRLLGVGDWRCYGVALMSVPVLNSLLLGAITPLLLLGTAAAWRYRERWAAGGTLVAVVTVAKLFLWPLSVWLLVTRRYRAVSAFVLGSALLVIAGWATIGFAGLLSYPHLLRVLSNVEEARGYGIVALAHVSGRSAEVVTLGLIALLLVGIAIAGRGEDADRRAFSVAVVGSLLVTPLLWLHYFVLLFVPIALYRPRLSALWFVPLLLWLTPVTQPQGNLWRICLALGIAAIVTAVTIGERRLSSLYGVGALGPTRPRNSNPA